MRCRAPIQRGELSPRLAQRGIVDVDIWVRPVNGPRYRELGHLQGWGWGSMEETLNGIELNPTLNVQMLFLKRGNMMFRSFLDICYVVLCFHVT